MTVDDILKRAKTCKNTRAKWKWYELYKSDLARAGLTPVQYQDAIKRLMKAMKV